MCYLWYQIILLFCTKSKGRKQSFSILWNTPTNLKLLILSQQTFSLAGKAQVQPITLMMSMFPHKPWQWASVHDPGPGTPEWNTAIVIVSNYTCVFPAGVSICLLWKRSFLHAGLLSCITPEWNSAIINITSDTCSSPALTSHNVSCEINTVHQKHSQNQATYAGVLSISHCGILSVWQVLRSCLLSFNVQKHISFCLTCTNLRIYCNIVELHVFCW